MHARFDVWAEAYDAMVDWDKRLAREGPFYRRLFDEAGVRRVLDAACGSGRHAAMFASWGLEVVGADLSPGMIQHCQAVYRHATGLSFVVRSFSEPANELFDAVVCAGNSLPLLENMPQVDGAIAAMLASVRPGGIVVVHALNLAHREEGPVRWDKCKRVHLSGGESLIIKGTHVAGAYGYVDFVLTDLEHDPPQLSVDSVRLLRLDANGLVASFRRHGGGLIGLYGSYSLDGFAPERSNDIILVATRAAG